MNWSKAKTYMVAYLKGRLGTILFFCLIEGVFVLLWGLYDVDRWAGILYPFLLVNCFGLIGLLIGGYRYTRQMFEWSRYMKQLDNESLQRSWAFGTDYVWLCEIVDMMNTYEQEIARIRKQVKDSETYHTMWSHQIKTPISSLRLMLSSGDNRIASKVAYPLLEEVLRIEQYVDMVLYYQRMMDAGEDLILQPESLQKLVNDALKRYSIYFINRHLSVNVSVGDERILTDGKWMGFVLEQLISNAIKYTQTGGISIHTYKEDNHLYLIIEDTGIGIRQEDLPRIFERGFTGYNGRGEQKSTGIGLFLVKRVLTMLGHDIVVTSIEGKGTKVTVTLQQCKVQR